MIEYIKMGSGTSKDVADHIMKLTKKQTTDYFSGTWYEQARLYTFFERKCRGVSSVYNSKDTDDIKITNKCLWESEEYQMSGTASKMFPGSDLAAFYVQYNMSPLYGYYIIYAENITNKHGIALVSGDDFSYFWVLTRDKNYDKTRVCHILRSIELPLDYSKLIWNDGEKCVSE